jgi:hypothetical protein
MWTVIVSPPRSEPAAVKATVQVARAAALCGAPVKATAVGVPGAEIVTGEAFAAVASALVLTLSVEEPGEVLVTPAIVSDAAVLAGRRQVPALLARVTVATAPAPVAVAEQLVNPAPSVTVVEAGTEKPGEKATVIVLSAFRAPLVVGVKSTVQSARARATSEVALTLTAVGAPAAAIVTAAALAGCVSAAVASVWIEEPVVEVFVTPESAKDPVVLSGREHVPPKSARVTIAIVPEPDALAEQFAKPFS